MYTDIYEEICMCDTWMCACIAVCACVFTRESVYVCMCEHASVFTCVSVFLYVLV